MSADTGTRLQAALESIKAGLPPVPSSTRFKPLRMGLLGIWEYEGQEFYFHDGRLVLLGRNGSGKTKVLEVTSPFLFDANLTARRLDPFGHNSRSMRDNLLFGNRKHQVGYVWCEYGRIDATGQPTYVTIGAGLRALASKPGPPESWYFVTPMRVGVDFNLHDDKWDAAGKPELTVQIGADQVFATADGYRSAVADQLFGMSPLRFRTLVELLLTMRKPKLSENFGVDKLTATISEGLPPVDGGLIDELARGFDELARDREGLEGLERVARHVDRFLNTYRGYARCMVRYYAARLRSANTRYDAVTRRKREAEQQLEESQSTLEALQAQLESVRGYIVEQNARIRTLEQRPEIEQHTMLRALKDRADKTREQAEHAAERLAEVQREQELSEIEMEDAETALAEAREHFDASERAAVSAAAACGLDDEHHIRIGRLATDPAHVKQVLNVLIDARRAAVRNTRALVQAADRAQHEFERVQMFRDDLVARREELGRKLTAQQAALTAEIEAVSTALVSWAEDCRELGLDRADVDKMLRAVEQAGQPGVLAPKEITNRRAAVAESALLHRKAVADATQERLRAEHGHLVEQRGATAAEKDAPPPPPHARRRDRSAEPIPGAPLWMIVDFAVDVPEHVRWNVESALLGAGLLDAWVTPSGTVLDPDTLEVVLTAGRRASHERTLGAVLVPADQTAVDIGRVVTVLDRVGYYNAAGTGAEGDWVSGDGAWAVGPVRGRTRGEAVSFIGAAARAAAKLRRLREIDAQLDRLEAQIAQAGSERDQVHGRLAALAAERNACPDTARAAELSVRLDGMLTQAAELARSIEEADYRCEARAQAARDATAALHDYARDNYTGTTLESLGILEEHLVSYRESLFDLYTQADRFAVARSTASSTQSRLERIAQRYHRFVEQHRLLNDEAIELHAAYSTRHALVGAGVEQVLAELSAAQTRIERLHEQSNRAESDLRVAMQHLGAAGSTLDAVEEQRRERESERSAAAADFERLRAHGLLGLAEVPGVQKESTNLTASLETARTAEQHLQQEEMDEKARNKVRNDVDTGFRDLQTYLGGPDWRPWGDNENDLFIIKVAHNGTDHGIPELKAIIDDDIATRKTYLDENERKLFAEVLIGRVGEHLRECRARAVKLCQTMNDLLAKRPTASGRKMRLVWEPDPEAGANVRRVLEIFDQQGLNLISDESRQELIDFLAGRVRDTREADREGDWREHLREALDYRAWSRFRIEIRDRGGDQWIKLTDQKHQQGSGGEKAVMLQLPLFVAAAAHYEGTSRTAPRPIYLDEAFAGIDAEMRGECMKLLVDLDLDFVLASHDEWGFHAEVPGLVTYQLSGYEGEPGVLATPFLWDGEDRTELNDPTLSLEDPASGPLGETGLFDEND